MHIMCAAAAQFSCNQRASIKLQKAVNFKREHMARTSSSELQIGCTRHAAAYCAIYCSLKIAECVRRIFRAYLSAPRRPERVRERDANESLK